MTQNDPFCSAAFADYWQHREMNVNGLKCTLHLPQVVRRQFDAQGNERVAGLPPGNARPAFAVDEYPASPDSWMHGSSKASSYFVPVVAERGMWLDFTNNRGHTHDVAVVVSVQGINPLTGQKSDPIRMEQYRHKCPIHGTEFGQDLFCKECGYKWHPQNYVASTGSMPLWIDGFRTEDGVVRQWYFTEEECKGIAHQVIGDDKVYAIGIAFYLSKEAKPRPKYRGTRSFLSAGGGGLESMMMPKGIGASKLGSPSYGAAMPASYGGSDDFELLASCSLSAAMPAGSTMDSLEVPESMELLGGSLESLKADIEETQTKLEIGAGAKIDQQISRDPKNLDYWEDEPAGFIYINYCDVATAQRILGAGKRQEKSEGFLSGLEIKD